MAKPEHKHCQYLVSAFVDPYSLKPARSKEVQNFWKLQIKFAKTILEKDPDIKFWVFLKQKAQKDKYLKSLIWFLGDKGKKFLCDKRLEYKTFLFDFPQPKRYLLKNEKVGESLNDEKVSKPTNILNFLKKDYGKKA
tara:strand:- start:776 stop:1186 length:411 start_codon:yes stop_codon:yes gene_type:complete